MHNTFNFIAPNLSEEDKDLFFGPLDEEEFIVIEENWTMAHLLTAAGVFPSVTQARKNNQDTPIPWGFNIITRGKKAKRKVIFICKI